MRAALFTLVIIAVLAAMNSASAADCTRGHAAVEGTCGPIQIPPNARLNPWGDGWVCGWGYERVGKTCAPINLPRNATLSPYGDTWTCNPGYYELRGICLAEENPARRVRASPSFVPRVFRAPEVSLTRQSAGQARDSRRDDILTFVIAIAITGIGIYLFRDREPPARANIPMAAYVPRPRRAVVVTAWRTFGDKVDALTGALIPDAVAAVQCRNCQACYRAESAMALRRENGARCVACGRVALARNVA